MKKNKKHQTKVSTNLEKKNRQKIASSSSGGATDLLTDFKLLSKFKKCHVRVARLNKNTLGKIAKKKEKPQKKVRATPSRGGVNKKKPDVRGRTKKFKAAQSPAKTEKQVPHIEVQKQKASPESSKRNKEKKKQPIFIRLPFLENAKIKSLNKDLIQKPYKKKARPIKRLGKTYLTERFGSRFFRCHVKVARYRDPNEPAPKKKDTFNRKSVSFLETVEIFGESDDQSNDESPVTNSPGTSTPIQEICNISGSNDSITISPSKRKVSLLKNSESPRSEHMRMSDEKLPGAKSVNRKSLVVTVAQINNTYQEAEGEELPSVSGAEDSNEHESLNMDETEHEILPEDERMDEDEEEAEEEAEEAEEEGKDKYSDQPDEGNNEEKELDKKEVVSEDETVHNQNDDVRTCDEDSQEMSDNDNDSVKKDDSNTEQQSVDENVNTFEDATSKDFDQEGTSHERTEDDDETSNDQPREQMDSAGNNNNSNHIELSTSGDRESDIFFDIGIGGTTEAVNFADVDDQEKDFSLQISNNSEMSALCQKPDQSDPESNSVLSNAENIDSIIDDTPDTPQVQQTKFSLNTFFKSLKTKIIPQCTESIPPTKSSTQCTEREGDQTLRDELTIK